MSTSKTAATYLSIHVFWRGLLFVVGVLAIFTSFCLYQTPPLRWSGESTEGSPGSMAWAHADPTTFSLALLGFGAVTLLFVANGLKLMKVSKDGAEAALAPSAEVLEAAKESADASSKTIKVENEEAPKPEREAMKTVDGKAVFKPENIPIRVLADLHNKVREAFETTADIEFGFRQMGKGNHPWYIKMTDGETYRVAYGGSGKTDASISKDGN